MRRQCCDAPRLIHREHMRDVGIGSTQFLLRMSSTVALLSADPQRLKMIF
jgi:hypothetical protein